MNPNLEPLLSVKELAAVLGRHPSYLYGMRHAGFQMVGARATVQEALDWLRQNPHFNSFTCWGRAAVRERKKTQSPRLTARGKKPTLKP